MPLRIRHGHLQRNRPLRTRKRVTQIDHDLGVMILSCCVHGRVVPLCALAAAKHRFEEVAEIALCAAFVTSSTVFKAVVPVRRRPEVLSIIGFLAQSVVGRPLLWILEHLIGFADVLKACFRVSLLVEIRMKFTGELAMSGLDLGLSRRARQAHRFVVVFVLHRRFHPSHVLTYKSIWTVKL